MMTIHTYIHTYIHTVHYSLIVGRGVGRDSSVVVVVAGVVL